MKVKWLVLICLLMAALVGAGCAPAKAPMPTAKAPAGYENIRIVGASIGSGGTTAVMAFAKILNMYYPQIEWSSCSGITGTNPIYITQGNMKLGLAVVPNYVDAYGFEKIPQSRLRSMNIPVPIMNYTFFIPETEPWKDITEVPKGTVLCPGAAGTGLVISAEAWLNVCGLSKKDFNWIPMGKAEMADAWRAGKFDVGFANFDTPTPWLLDMVTSRRKPKLMGMTQAQVDKARAERVFERLGFLSPEMSSAVELLPKIFTSDVYCPKSEYYLICRDDFPEEIAYKMAKVSDEHRTELAETYLGLKHSTPQVHIKYARAPFEIHPGVAKYYREKGYLK